MEEEEWTEPRRRETGRKRDVIEATTEIAREKKCDFCLDIVFKYS